MRKIVLAFAIIVLVASESLAATTYVRQNYPQQGGYRIVPQNTRVVPAYNNGNYGYNDPYYNNNRYRRYRSQQTDMADNKTVRKIETARTLYNIFNR